jgi:Di-haem oxidoreductase, putative peroxidase
LAGEALFSKVGCTVCHAPSITTARPGAKINGGVFTVPAALGNKIIHPYSDFLLHDIGTCDGIPVLPLPEYASTANQMRTAPLWALRTRNRLMHEGLSFTKQDAIQRHAGQAAGVTQNCNAVRGREKSIVSIPGFAVTEAVETGITELLQAKRNENPECQSPRLVMTSPPPDRATEKESCVVARRFARGAIIEALAQERKERQPWRDRTL